MTTIDNLLKNLRTLLPPKSMIRIQDASFLGKDWVEVVVKRNGQRTQGHLCKVSKTGELLKIPRELSHPKEVRAEELKLRRECAELNRRFPPKKLQWINL